MDDLTKLEILRRYNFSKMAARDCGFCIGFGNIRQAIIAGIDNLSEGRHTSLEEVIGAERIAYMCMGVMLTRYVAHPTSELAQYKDDPDIAALIEHERLTWILAARIDKYMDALHGGRDIGPESDEYNGIFQVLGSMDACDTEHIASKIKRLERKLGLPVTRDGTMYIKDRFAP